MKFVSYFLVSHTQPRVDDPRSFYFDFRGSEVTGVSDPCGVRGERWEESGGVQDR